MCENEVRKTKIVGICIRVYRENTSATYEIYNPSPENAGQDSYVTMHEKFLFPSKEALLASL
jgi:hypothetical protein